MLLIIGCRHESGKFNLTLLITMVTIEVKLKIKSEQISM